MKLIANRKKPSYGIKHFLINSDEDVSSLPKCFEAGSSATNPGSGHTWVFTGSMWVSSGAPSPEGTLDEHYAMTDEEILEILQ